MRLALEKKWKERRWTSGFDGTAGLAHPRGKGWRVCDPPEDKRTTCV